VFKEHRVFQKPEDENAKIWRYMDFTKFVSLLDTKSLYFTRVDRLGDVVVEVVRRKEDSWGKLICLEVCLKV
jgi:hypothetical protein